jgi:hypothetical protein
MIDKLFQKAFGEDFDPKSKQYLHLKKKMVKTRKININDKPLFLKTFSYKEAEKDNDFIRQNCKEHWGVTTNSLHPLDDAAEHKVIDDESDTFNDDIFFDHNSPPYDQTSFDFFTGTH